MMYVILLLTDVGHCFGRYGAFIRTTEHTRDIPRERMVWHRKIH